MENLNLTYEILDNGYQILKDGEIWIIQVDPFIPDPTLSYEENAKAHIESILNQPEPVDELAQVKEDIINTQLALTEVYELILGGGLNG